MNSRETVNISAKEIEAALAVLEVSRNELPTNKEDADKILKKKYFKFALIYHPDKASADTKKKF